MIEPRYNHQSLRSRKARLTVGISPVWRLMLKVMAFGLVISGMSLIVIKDSLGWLALGMTSVPVMVYQWWRYNLYRLEIIENEHQTVDDVLSSSVLGRLPDNPSPYDIATIVGTTSSGIFIGLRFGTGVRFFQEIASKNSADTEQIWRDAIAIREQTGSRTISEGRSEEHTSELQSH